MRELKMNREDLLKRLEKLGYPLFDVENTEDANSTLAEMVRSDDQRLLEGFPVVLANSANRGLFDYEAVKAYLKESLERDRLFSLLVMSLALYSVLSVKFSWADKLYKNLNNDGKKMFAMVLKNFKKNEDLKFSGYSVSGERLKQTFNNYLNQERLNLNDMLSVKEGMGLEYALSQVFSPKQKELFLKKLRHEKLTKTEKEYYSRTVKKKVLALVNSELHRLSKKLLEE
jgi:hypothetical protein